jgi:hypothetical protein
MDIGSLLPGSRRGGFALPAAALLMTLTMTCFALFVVKVDSAHAATETIKVPVAADSYVRSDRANTNYGTNTRVREDGSPTTRSYLRFNVPARTDGTVTSAKLALYPVVGGAGLSVKKASSSSWGEKTITYNNAPSFGSTIATKSSYSSGTIMRTTDFSSSVTLGQANTFVVTATSTTEQRQPSREDTTHPAAVLELTVTTPDSTPTSPPPPTDPPPTTTPAATPLWNGSTLACGSWAPYKSASASIGGGDASAGTPQCYSGAANEPSNGHSIGTVADPDGSGRQVIQINTDEDEGSADGRVRVNLKAPGMFDVGMDRWIYQEYRWPSSNPAWPSSGWWSWSSVYTGGGSGSGPFTMQVDTNSSGQTNIVWNDNNNPDYFSVPLTRNVWHRLARHVHFDTNSNTGWVEFYYAAGRNTPLQPVSINGQTRFHYAVLVPGVNYIAGQLSYPTITSYHQDNVPGWTAPGMKSTVYAADFKVYDGSATLQQIDPYYTHVG